MKKGLAIIMALSLLLSLTGGCGRLEGSISPAGMTSLEGNKTEGTKSSGKNSGEDGKKSSEGKSNSQSSSSIPSNAYWATYSGIPDKLSSPDEIAVEGPLYVARVEIGEMSTSELLASVEFEQGETCATYSNPNDGSQYWVERIQSAEGQTTGLKLGSTAANDFYLNLMLNSVSDNSPALSVNCLRSDSGVHSPDGSVLSDPYEDPENPIAGFKELKFYASFKQGGEIKESVENAGYSTRFLSYDEGIYSLSAMRELEGRAKIEETVLEPEHWKPDKSLTKGNVGVYSYSDGFTGEIAFDWSYSGIAFKIEIKDAKLVLRDDGPDETNYTLSGTAEISPTSFTIDDTVFKLSDNREKSFSNEYGFKVLKTPKPAVRWDYVEMWEYVSESGIPYPVTITFITGRSPTDFDDVPVSDVDELDGSYTMNFLMPAMGGTATWKFQSETR